MTTPFASHMLNWVLDLVPCSETRNEKRNKRVAKCVLTIFLFYFFNLKTFDNKSAYQS